MAIEEIGSLAAGQKVAEAQVSVMAGANKQTEAVVGKLLEGIEAPALPEGVGQKVNLQA